MFDLQLLSQCGRTYNCLSRFVPEIHSPVAGTLSNQQTNKQTLSLPLSPLFLPASVLPSLPPSLLPSTLVIHWPLADDVLYTVAQDGWSAVGCDQTCSYRQSPCRQPLLPLLGFPQWGSSHCDIDLLHLFSALRGEKGGGG